MPRKARETIIDLTLDQQLEREYDMAHYWPDSLIVDGHDVEGERRARIRQMNTLRQQEEAHKEKDREWSGPSGRELAEIQKELGEQ